jgi:cell division protein FtsQ
MESVLAAALRLPRRRLLSAMPRLRQPGRRPLLIALLVAALLGGGFLLFRDSSFVAVERVQISGVRGAQAAAVSDALEAAARRMSTLDFSVGELQAAVAQYPQVKALQISTGFPHQMRIEVQEQLPVAELSAGGSRTAVAADGVVLGPAFVSRSLPSIPEAVLPIPGRHVEGQRLRAYLSVLGAAPQPLLALVGRIYVGPQGLTLRMRNGLLAYFGDATRPHAKWDSLVTVLIDPSSAGASYVDVRVPERPAAGVPNRGVGSGEAAGVSASDPTSAALAENLAKAVNGEPSSSAPVPSAPAGEESPSNEGGG